MKIVLLGYMGSGKSSVGKALSDKLKFPFKDLDFELEKEARQSISQLFSEKGELYFRKKENLLLKKLLLPDGNLVLATGGGTPCYGDALDFLIENKSVVSVYLKCDVAPLSKRLYLEKDHRPLLSHLNDEFAVFDFIRKHLFERSFYYSQANITIKTDELSIEEIVEKIVEKLF